MFDRFTKNKFYIKCKSHIKVIKKRIDVIKKKRNAMQKFLKNDIADLLKNGLDSNAYGRAEGLLVELNLSTCYDFLEQFCVQIYNNLAALDKQRECLEECREAVSSVMFAAARIADPPELRELRDVFTNRYGNSLDCFVNKLFVEKLKSGAPTKDTKLQLMQDIATEYGLKWNSVTTEQKLHNSPGYKRDLARNSSIADELKTHEKVDNGVQIPYEESCNEVDRIPFKDIHMDKTGRERQANEQSNSISPSYNKSRTGETRNEYETSKPAEVKECRDDPVEKTKRKPVSVRTRLAKPVSGGDDVRKEQKQDHNQPDEEERMLDKLLLHYSQKKRLSRNEIRKSESESVTEPPLQQAVVDSSRARRAPSLSIEPQTELRTRAGHARATSLQPEMSNPKGIVHPKLPEYDEFVARLAALRAEK